MIHSLFLGLCDQRSLFYLTLVPLFSRIYDGDKLPILRIRDCNGRALKNASIIVDRVLNCGRVLDQPRGVRSVNALSN